MKILKNLKPLKKQKVLSESFRKKMEVGWGALLSFAGFFLVFYLWLRYHYSFWDRMKVANIKPLFFIGNLGPYLKMQASPPDFMRDLYNHPAGKDKAFVGIHFFHKPAILVKDPELVKRILIKDFNKFSNRYSNSDYKGDPLGSQNIFFLKNPAWKEVRFKLSPFFTSTKLKQMFSLIEKVGQNMDSYLLNHSLENVEEKSFSLEMKEFCALYTTDVIATVAFGIQANSFINTNGDFRRNGREVFRFTLKRAAGFTFVFFLPHLVPYLNFKVVPAESTKFFRSTLKYVIEEREKSGKTRNDLIDILIEFKKASLAQNSSSSSGNVVFEGDILIAQAVLFFTAGFESSSSLMSFVLYEMAKSPQNQLRLRQEIREALTKSQGEVTPKLIDSLEYMHMVILEALRMYPPLPFLDRECTFQENGKGYSLEPFAKFEMPKGMPAFIPVYGIHKDPKFYPEPEVFDPERFSPDNKKFLTPYTFMPFGLGPHACIGERFGILQAKIGLLHFLRNHRVAVGPKTPQHMRLDSKAIIIQAADGVNLTVIRDPLLC